MNKLISDSEGHLKLTFNDEDDNTLYVVFGALNCLNKLYFLERQMDNLKKNVLYINSERNDWFVEPQSFLARGSVRDSAIVLSDYINELVQKHNFASIRFLGHSLGAYGLLIYSQYMTFSVPHKIIISNPKIDITFSYLKVVRDHYSIDLSNDYKNLYGITDKLMNIPLINREYVFIYGEQDLFDVYAALYFQKKFKEFGEAKFQMVSIKDSGHYLFRNLQEIGLDKSLDDIFEGDYDALITRGDLHNKLDFSDIEKLVKLKVNFDLDSEYISFLKKIVKYKYPSYYFGLNRIGVAYLKARRYREALNYLQIAYKIAPNDVNNNTHLAQCYEQLSFYQSAIVHLSLCLKYSRVEAQKMNYLSRIQTMCNKLL